MPDFGAQPPAASDLPGGDVPADPALTPLQPVDTAVADPDAGEEPPASPLLGDPQAVDPVHSALPMSEGGHPILSHLASYDGYMNHSYDTLQAV